MRFHLYPSILFLICLLLLGCRTPALPEAAPDLLALIPQQTDWVDCGDIFTAGAEGEWDYYLWGGFAATAVKQNNTYYLYYQGSNGYDDATDTVTYRAIGVATSSDGLHFTQYAQNPVLTWLPNNHLEEGTTSGGAFVDENGRIHIFYGANSWIGGEKVSADGRWATSDDGFTFTDNGIILDHNDNNVWGSRDELFPIIGYTDNGRWFTYYIPNGSLQKGQLGAAWGDSADALTQSAPVQSGRNKLASWGPGGLARLDAHTYALFLHNNDDPQTAVHELRIVSPDSPNQVSEPIARYEFDNVLKATILYDPDIHTWFLYYRHTDFDRYGVKIARTDGQPAQCGP